MRTIRMALCILCFLWLSIEGYAQDVVEQIGHFKNVSGQVEIYRNDSPLHVEPGDYLLSSDRIVTGDGSAGIIFIDGTLLSLGANSSVHLETYIFDPQQQKYAFDIFMKKGTAIYSSGSLGKITPKAVKLKTPRAVVGIRGTRLILQVR